MKKIWVGFLMTMGAMPAIAVTISGTVTDKSGEPLVGATVRVPGSSLGVTADIDGKFTLTVPENTTEIQISFTGCTPQTFSPTDISSKITLTCNTDLDEVVVTGTWTSRSCNDEELKPLNAKSGHTARKADVKGIICVPDTCNEPQYKLTGSGDNATCEDQVGKTCKAPKNADNAKYIMENGKLICSPTCKTNYVINDAKTGCDASDGPCPQEQVAAIENATKGELKKGKCIATECKPGFEPSDGKCVAIAGKCAQMPENAKSAHREFDAATKTEVCLIDECVSGFHRSDDKKSCVADAKPKLSEEDSKKQIEELRDNAQKMRDKEQSTENKLLGAAAIGTTGIGAMNLMSGAAEQSADDDAERAMRAYLETFRCDYGRGANIRGGDVDIELPGGNDLMPLYNEYRALAAELQVTKNALGMMPGIESETILDKANTGLYDDVGTGITGGAYTSVARALMDSTGADAAAWAQQKADAEQKTKTGLITTASGIGIGIVGNLALNSGASKKDQTDKILAKYAPLKTLEDNVAKLPDNDPKTCPAGTTGTHPNCNCDKEFVYNANTRTCDCPDGTKPSDGDTCVTTNITPQCNTNADYVQYDPSTGKCSCPEGFQKTSNPESPCVCPSETHEVKDDLCVKKNTVTSMQVVESQSIPLPADKLFETGKSTLKTDATTELADFAVRFASATKGSTDPYCIVIVGHTDSTGTWAINQKLSNDRAAAVRNVLTSNKIPAPNIRTTGLANTKCQEQRPIPSDDCRKVTITVTNNACQ